MKYSQLKSLIKKIVTESIILENIADPSKDEMFNYLHQMYGNEEGFRDDAEVAIYWFASFFHGGQSSNLYSILSTSRFHPGPMAKGPEPQSSEEMMYEDLVLHFAPKSEEAIEIQNKHNSMNENDGNTSDTTLFVYGPPTPNSRSAGWSFLGKGNFSIEDALKQYPNAIWILTNPGENNQKAVWTKQHGKVTEGDEADAANDMWAGSDDDSMTPPINKQKSKTFFGKPTPKKKLSVQDLDWSGIKNRIDKGTLKENSVSDKDVDYVEYVSQRQGEVPFTMKTGNGKEKFEYVNAKYPSGKVDIGVYAFRGDIVYSYEYFRKLFNIQESKKKH